jgi:hypothetical protein
MELRPRGRRTGPGGGRCALLADDAPGRAAAAAEGGVVPEGATDARGGAAAVSRTSIGPVSLRSSDILGRGGAHVPGRVQTETRSGDIFVVLARSLKAGEREFGPVTGTAGSDRRSCTLLPI